MASLLRRADAWHCQFLFEKRRYTVSFGKVSDRDAERRRIRVEQLLQWIKDGLKTVPDDCSINDFILNDGEAKTQTNQQHKPTTLTKLREDYVTTFSNGAIEANTLYTAKIHLNHLEETLGKRFLLIGLTLASLQGHINRRQTSVAAVTIRKEINTFRATWNWGERMGLVKGKFPSAGLVYPKSDEKLPFMTWAEIERRIKAGGVAAELWDALYLDAKQIEEFLGYVKAKKAPAWVYAMFVMAAHTGARRSEMMRMTTADIDLTANVVTIREKKRAKGLRTTRRCPLTKTLIAALKPLMAEDRTYLFGDGEAPLTVDAAHWVFERTMGKSKWENLRGYHVLRHSFVSACAIKGIDQRMLQDWCGHMSAAMSRRYTHLLPSNQKAALDTVFG